MNLDRNGNFKSPGSIVNTCSLMIHNMRLVAVRQISDESSEDEEPDAVLR
jgi:hypothetical protein